MSMWPSPTDPTMDGCDVLVAGDVFLDLVFAGVDGVPRPGTEVRARDFGIAPGGIANQAIASRRLGLSVSMCSAIGDDAAGSWCREILSNEGVDLSFVVAAAQTSATASLAVEGDRAMVTWDAPRPADSAAPFRDLGDPKSIILYLDGREIGGDEMRTAITRGAKVFADVAWDAGETWRRDTLEALAGCHAFLPNAVEAMAYTGTEDPHRALSVLAETIPVAVVTQGAAGAIAVDSLTGESAAVAGVPVRAVDTTGAGDVFVSGFVAATEWGLSLRDRLELASLAAALSTTRVTGSLSAPTLDDIAAWRRAADGRAQCGDTDAQDMRRRFAFIDDLPELARAAHPPTVPGPPPREETP